ncbi:MAG: hypothetical protein HYW57_01155 [Ignavibacteriales bacterium]|nr:hypothetical protein [Ignavibacteriales bacterium]
MSIYSALEFEVPTIAYCVLHQRHKGIAVEDYRKTMTDLHRLIREESESINAIWKKYRDDVSAHAIQTQRSLLSQFLSTPLKSDSEEIGNILKGELAEHVKRIVPSDPFGIVAATEGQLTFGVQGKGKFKTLLSSGRKYIADLGFQTGRGHADIFESMFVVRGGQNLDVIEHIVRDRVGIYTPVHGKHIREFDSYANAAYNLIYLSGGIEAGGRLEASLFFSKGDTRYAPFRNALQEVLDGLQERHQLPHVSVWQRKLGLGGGKEFVLRLRGSDAKAMEAVIMNLPALGRKDFVSKALYRGHLVLKEMVMS